MEAPVPKADFYLSPQGNDEWSGRLPEPNAAGTDGPFAGLARARDAVRLESSEARPPRVLVRGGLYRIAATVVFGPDDSGTAAAPIEYAAWPGERPVFSGARSIRDWRRLDASSRPPAIPAAADVWAAPLPMLNGRPWRPRCLYDGGEALPRASSPGFTPLAPPKKPEGPDNSWVRCPEGLLRDWDNLADVEISLLPTHAFAHNILPLAAVDVAAGLARTTVPGTYPLAASRSHCGLPKGESAWIENALEDLNAPGRWAVDSRRQQLYYWPRADNPGDDVCAPVLTELLRLEGNEDDNQPVRHLRFRGLTFSHGDRADWTVADKGLQHDWEMFDKPNALVRLRGAEQIQFDDCCFSDSGGSGLRLDLWCQHNRVAASEFRELGGVGVLLAGYGPGTRDVSKHNEIVGNHLHRCGRLRWHSPAIFVWQSGENRIAGNEIHDLPYAGIVLSGVRPHFFRQPVRRECSSTIRFDETGAPETYADALPFLHTRNNIVEDNELYRAMQVLGDGNGIYISGSGHGNVIGRNYVHDILGPGTQSAIRIDDFQEGTLVADNIVYRCVAGGITLKHCNDVLNNIVVGLLQRPSPEAEELPLFGYLLLRRGPIEGARIQRNIFCHLGGEQPFYCEGRNASWTMAFAREADTDYNLYWCTDSPEWTREFLEEKRQEGIEAHGVAADPMFRDLVAGCFELSPESPAFDIGFQPIDISCVGRRGGGAR